MGGGGVRSPPPPFPTIPPPSAARPPAPPPPGGSWKEGTPQVTQGAGFAREGFCTPKGAAKKKPQQTNNKKTPTGEGGGSKGRCAPSPRTFAVASVLAALAVGSGVCGGGALGAAALGVCEGVLWGVWVRSGKTRV